MVWLVEHNNAGKRSKEEEISGEELTAWERKRLRVIIKADDRARWLWGTVRTFALWVTAVSVAVMATKNFIIDFFAAAGVKH